MSRGSGFVRLMRPINCAMMGAAVIVGAVLAGLEETRNQSFNLPLGFVTGFALTAASMATNDYYDREVDRINEPSRPISSGLVEPNEALAFAFVLTGVGFATAYLTSLACFLLSVFAWAIFTAYTTIGKRSGLLGNLLVSTCVTIPIVYGSVMVRGGIELNVLLFASMAFLSNTGREITKGIADVEGDKSKNVRTLAVRYGAKNAALAASAFYFSAVVLSLLPPVLEIVSFWFVPFVLTTDLGFIFSSILVLRDYSRRNARRVKNTVLLWFMTGLLAFVAGVMG